MFDLLIFTICLFFVNTLVEFENFVKPNLNKVLGSVKRLGLNDDDDDDWWCWWWR